VETRHLGSSNLRVSVFGLGCWPLGGGRGWGHADERQSIATIHAALDHGINLLDTAEAYNRGHSEEIVGKALLGRRGQALIATKVSPRNADPAALRAHCEASLRRLQTDYIDLYQVHWPVADAAVKDAFATLQDLRDEGKVRFIGVSNHGLHQLTEAIDTGAALVSNQLCYNLLSRAIETAIAPFCHQQGISIIAYMGLMHGLLAGIYATPDDVPAFRARTRHFGSERALAHHGEPGAEAETFEALDRIRRIADQLAMPMARLALAWVAARPGVACVLVGGRKPAQLERNLAAASVTLSPEIIAALDEATEPLRRKLGPSVDYWQGSAESRSR